jgi:membrane fusion protein (multidrug efflux system)
MAEFRSKTEETDPPPEHGLRGRKPSKWGFRLIILCVIAGAALYLAPRAEYYFSHESTDDAYVTGAVVPISAQVKGKVVTVSINDNQFVNAGDPLFEIESDDYAATMDQSEKGLLRLAAEENQMRAFLQEGKESMAKAQADLVSAKAKEDFAYKEIARYEELSKTRAVPQNELDRVRSQWRVAEASTKSAEAAVAQAQAGVQSLEAQLKTQKMKIAEAQASLELAKINLRRTQIKAPFTGRIAKKNVDPGKYAQPGQPLLSLVDARDTWIVANFKETEIMKMRVGQPVDIEVDAYPGMDFKGHIDSFQPGTGAVFSLLPPENATGNFVKIVQRVPVKIVLDSEPDPAHPLWPGLSVTPYVDVSDKGKP